MPEQNFEQQARDMANNFSMEPNPAVWQRVEAVIAPPKRKRRILIWWWLFPLLITGGFAVLYKADKHKNENKNVAKEQKIKNGKIKTQQNALVQPIDRTGQMNVENNSRRITIDKAARNYKMVTGKAFNSKNKEHNRPVKESKETVISNTYTSSEKGVLKLKEPIASNNIHNNRDSLQNNSDSNSLHVTDTLNLDNKTLLAHADSLDKKKDSTSTAISIKKHRSKKWQLGILGEVGATASGNSFFKSSTINNAFSSGANSPGTLDNLSNSTSIINSSVKNGMYVSAGVAAKKSLSGKIFMSGSLRYQYQRLNVTKELKDSLSLPANNPAAIYYSVIEKQKLHLVSMYTGLGLQLLKGKRSNLSLEAGFDNSLLIKASRNKTGLTQRLDSLTSLSTTNFYRWQPYFTTALSFNVDVSKTKQLQLSPIMHFGLRKFQKNNVDNKNNRIRSAGLQVIYFFK